jgi:hypothetical protein
MSPTGFIEDGYNIEAWIEGEEHLYPRVDFTYRPALRGEVQAHLRQFEKAHKADSHDRARYFTAEFVAAHIMDWNIQNASGQTIEVSADNVERLVSNLWGRLYSIILGNEGPDGVMGEPLNEAESAKNSKRA